MNSQTKEGNHNEESIIIKDDPLLQLPPSVVRDGDYVILVFAGGQRQCIAQALKQKSWKSKHAPFKFQKKSYSTNNLIGLPYGTVLEIDPSVGLVPLPEGEDVVPRYPVITTCSTSTTTSSQNISSATTATSAALEDENEANADDSTFPAVRTEDLTTSRRMVIDNGGTNSNSVMNVNPGDINLHHHHPENQHLHTSNLNSNEQINDNGHIVDNNDSQQLDSTQIRKMVEDGAHGSTIVSKLVENSSSFGQKTTFSQAKYIARKQRKYQPRCRIVKCTPLTICEAFYKNKARQILNMREDTLGQILSYSNVSAGCQVLVYEHTMGILTGAVAQRMGGYGQVLSLYETQQPSYTEMIQKFNLSFGEHQSIKWIHTGDVFGRHHDRDQNGVDQTLTTPTEEKEEKVGDSERKSPDADPEKEERDSLTWPIVLQEHTRKFLEDMKTDKERKAFLKKRCDRFARKLTRNTPKECNEFLFGSTPKSSLSSSSSKAKWTRKCDSIILAIGQYDSTTVLLDLWEFLAPSSPFVVYCEYIEPLTECFYTLQQEKLAINLRLSDTWTREYQVLPGRTHPAMNMSQSGGFILTGIKLDPVYGHNELDEDLAKEIRQQIGGRRGKKKKRKDPEEESNDEGNGDGEKNKNAVGDKSKEDDTDFNKAKKQRFS